MPLHTDQGLFAPFGTCPLKQSIGNAGRHSPLLFSSCKQQLSDARVLQAPVPGGAFALEVGGPLRRLRALLHRQYVGE